MGTVTNGGRGGERGRQPTVTLSGDGVYSIMAKVTDVAGNTAPTSSQVELTLETVAPDGGHQHWRRTV